MALASNQILTSHGQPTVSQSDSHHNTFQSKAEIDFWATLTPKDWDQCLGLPVSFSNSNLQFDALDNTGTRTTSGSDDIGNESNLRNASDRDISTRTRGDWPYSLPRWPATPQPASQWVKGSAPKQTSSKLHNIDATHTIEKEFAIQQVIDF